MASASEAERMRKNVREGYAQIARGELGCAPAASCCDTSRAQEQASERMGYSKSELQSLPEGANLGLGCGNPAALASLNEGETVLDLGSGAGIDCFLAAKRVGPQGKVIGVDMTPAMIDKARENAQKVNYDTVEFRLGEIENLPVADNTVDVIISNCVINLSPNKRRVFEEAFRVLKPGGRLLVSDMVLLKDIPESTKQRAHPASCVPGALRKEDYLETIKQAGFQQVQTVKETRSTFEDVINDPNARVVVRNKERDIDEVKTLREAGEDIRDMARQIMDSTASISVSGVKPPQNER